MVQPDLTTMGTIYAAAIIAIGFSFFSNSYLQTKLRSQELKIQLNQITLEDALKETEKQHFWAKIIFVGLLVSIAVMYMLIISVSPPPSTGGNITNICVNCTYPVTNVVNNYNVTFTPICEKNTPPQFSVNGLKYLMGQNPRPKILFSHQIKETDTANI